MRIRRESETDELGINLTSLMDLMFILLIFFMATTTFKQEDREEMNLPLSRQSSSLSSDAKLLVINVKRATGIGRDYYVVASESKTLEQLQVTLNKAMKEDPNQKVLIRGDRLAFHEHVAAAVQACRIAGMLTAQIGYDATPTGQKN